jgi:phosphoesterase RecJ-like protein
MDSRRNPTPEQAAALGLVREGRSFLLVGHSKPDGDCIGAQAALARGLALLGKRATIVNPDPPPPEFGYLARECAYRAYGTGPLPEHDVAVFLDFNELSRTGAMEAPLAAYASKKLVVDHHPHHGTPFWDAAFVDVTAAATGLLVWRMLRVLGGPIDRVVATGTFTSIVTDTGWFRDSNTDAETLEVAAELVRAGVEPAVIYAAIYQQRPASEPRAISTLLGRVEYCADGRIAIVDHPLGDPPADALADNDPVLDILRSVARVEVVLYLREVERDVCKLSARSKTTYDVNALARRFGGGGHVKAAGATIRGRLAEVKARLIAAALEGLEPRPVGAGR